MLNDTGLKALKSKPKPYKLADAFGLFIQVETNGSKLWRFRYRFNGKQKLLSGGRYPDVGLAAARAWRDAARAQLAAGEDPSAIRKADKRAARLAEANDFESIAREWYDARKSQWSPRYAALVLGRFEADVFPEIGHLPIGAVDGPVLLGKLKEASKEPAA